jgi:hypothetical protein
MDDLRPGYSSKRLKPWVKTAAVTTLLLELSGCAHNYIIDTETKQKVAESKAILQRAASLRYKVNADGSYTVEAISSNEPIIKFPTITFNPHGTRFPGRFYR